MPQCRAVTTHQRPPRRTNLILAGSSTAPMVAAMVSILRRMKSKSGKQQVWEKNKLAKSVSTIKHENLLGRLPPIWSSSNARLCLRCALIPVLLACYIQCVAKTR
jgi:hypothetical protein